jgi:4-aminobutyrate aminotransferase/(S)-3-amino-2-methylpropionate transaminase
MALELVKNRETKTSAMDETKALTRLCHEKEFIVLSCGNFKNVIRTLMSLVVTDEQLERGLAIMEEALSGLSK